MSTWVQQAGRRGFKAVLSCGLPRKSRATPNNQQRTTIYATRRTRERLPHTLGTAFISSMLTGSTSCLRRIFSVRLLSRILPESDQRRFSLTLTEVKSFESVHLLDSVYQHSFLL